jgi:hypothetical protein
MKHGKEVLDLIDVSVSQAAIAVYLLSFLIDPEDGGSMFF